MASHDDRGSEDARRDAAAPAPHYERDEPRSVQLDRNWNELLQEIRVLQTSSQILAAFLIVLPFQSRFDQLDAFEVGWYLGLLVLALVIVVLLLTPVSVHRALFRRLEKDEIVDAANRVVRVALVLLALLLVGVAVLIFGFVLGLGAAAIAGGALLLLALGLQLLYPRMLRRGR